MKYSTGRAFRQALEERIRTIQSEQKIPMLRLRKQVTFERFVSRLIKTQPDRWVLKGGLALQIRLGLQARTTKDIDLLTIEMPSSIYAALSEAAALDLEDWFSFEIERPENDPDEEFGGSRYGVRCYLDGRMFEHFHVDVGVGDLVVDEFDWLPFESFLSFAGIEPTSVPCYPITQQIAEKFHALTRQYVSGHSTRIKDVVDILLLAGSGSIDGILLKKAIRTTFETRITHPIPTQVPDFPISYSRGYGRIARSVELGFGSFRDAEQALGKFLNPLLERSDPGGWDAASWSWTEP
jgi:hypothetical protein